MRLSALLVKIFTIMSFFVVFATSGWTACSETFIASWDTDSGNYSNTQPSSTSARYDIHAQSGNGSIRLYIQNDTSPITKVLEYNLYPDSDCSGTATSGSIQGLGGSGTIIKTSISNGAVYVLELHGQNARDFTVMFEYIASSPPEVIIPNLTVAANASFDISGYVNTSNGAGITSFAATGVPIGFSFDAVTGVFTGDGTTTLGSYSIDVNATDDTGLTSANDTFSLTVTDAVYISDVTISKETNVTDIYVGDSFQYNITVTNNGTEAATGVQVVDTLPYNLQDISYSDNNESNWTCNLTANQLTCDYDSNISGNTSSNIYVNVHAPTNPGFVTNHATVSSSNDSDSSNNAVHVKTYIRSLSTTAPDICYYDITSSGGKCDDSIGGFAVWDGSNGGDCTAFVSVRSSSINTETLSNVHIYKLYSPNIDTNYGSATGGTSRINSSTFNISGYQSYQGGWDYTLNDITVDNNFTISDTNTYYDYDGQDNNITSIILYATYTRSDGNYSGPLNSCDAFQYQGDDNVTYGVFDVVHTAYYPYHMQNGTVITAGDQYRNLPTQVTNRTDTFKVLAFKTDGTPLDVITGVKVEVVDDNCNETPRSQMQTVIIGTDTNDTQGDFNASENYAMQKARFRIISTQGENGGLITFTPTADNPPKFHLENFTAYAGDNCHEDFWDWTYKKDGTQKNLYHYQKVPVACFNAGTSSASAMSEAEKAICIRCILGGGPSSCSSDNFAIRPESFKMTIEDQNQTNGATPTTLGVNTSGATMPLNMAAGYKYIIEVNATNYFDANNTADYNTSNVVAKFIWEPRGGHITTGCNDINDSNTSITFSNGLAVATNLLNNQVGEYRLNIVDSNWTYVDSNPTHSGISFLGGSDCIVGETNVTVPGYNASKPPVGCNISSSHDASVIGSGFNYLDYNVTFHPYKFDLNMTGLSATGLPRAMTPSVGLTPNPITPTSYIYMADMSKDQNMSYHLNGYIRASGYNNDSNLSNFVGECYGKPIDINITKAIDVNNTLAYQYRFNNLDINDINISTTSGDLNNTTGPVQIFLSEGNFTDLNGSINSNLNLNFFREVNSSMNPRVVNFGTYRVDCKNADVNCTFNADLIPNKTTNGTLTLDHNITHNYGRTHAQRHRFVGPTGSAFIYYEAFCNGTDTNGISCNKVLLPNGVDSNSTNDPRWFKNTSHVQASYGIAGNINQKGFAIGAGHIDTSPSGTLDETTTGRSIAALTYDVSQGYPYIKTMENNASNWLIYNKYDANDTKNEFVVEFWKTGGKWAGKRETNTTTHSKGTERTNRRSMW